MEGRREGGGGMQHSNTNRITTTQRRVKQRTTLQSRRRNTYTKCVIAWKKTIKQNKTELWAIYAKNHPTVNKQGKTIILHGWNYFLRFNLYRIYNNLEPILKPPDD